jgi:hypothetical protein
MVWITNRQSALPRNLLTVLPDIYQLTQTEKSYPIDNQMNYPITDPAEQAEAPVLAG